MIDVKFDFRTDTPKGKDPDTWSPSLCAHHKFLWSKELPSGGVFELQESPLFVYKPRGLSGEFLKLCRRKGIDDLHFHDLRHEATSRLFEKGLNPVEVATITGHKDTKMLMRYTVLM